MLRCTVAAALTLMLSSAATAAPLLGLPAGIPGITAPTPTLPVLGSLPGLSQLPGLGGLPAGLGDSLPALPGLDSLPGLSGGAALPELPALALLPAGPLLPDLATLTAPITTNPQVSAIASAVLLTGTSALTSVVAPINAQVPIPVVGDLFGGAGN